MTRLKEQYGIKTDAEFEESLRKSGMARADMEARLHDTILMNKVFGRELRQRDELADKELKERYDREKERYRLPERARLREIIVIKPDDPAKVEAARERAERDLAAQARTGDFAKLATTSSDAGTKEKGGDLGEVARGELLPDLDKAVFNATAGTVLGPIETKSGWHILKVETRLPSEVPAFESVKDRLRKDAARTPGSATTRPTSTACARTPSSRSTSRTCRPCSSTPGIRMHTICALGDPFSPICRV